MATEPSKTADELTTAIRSLVDKALDARTRDEIAARGRELAAAIAETAGSAAERASIVANDAWRDSAPQRREAAKQARQMSRDALRWGRQRWKKQLRPAMRDAWDRRVVTGLGAAGVAVPASREIAQQARVRLGLKRAEERRWRTFFLGVIVGAVAGAIVALLTAPRPGREMRDELATRAREAANNAGEWVPLFQREEYIGSAAGPAAISDDLGTRTQAAESSTGTTASATRDVSPSAKTGGGSKGNGAEQPVAAAPDIPEEPEQETI
jgi:hypothetical protein